MARISRFGSSQELLDPLSDLMPGGMRSSSSLLESASICLATRTGAGLPWVLRTVQAQAQSSHTFSGTGAPANSGPI